MTLDLMRNSFSNLSICDREFIIGALTPLLHELISSGSDHETIRDYLNHLGFKTSDLDLILIEEKYQKEDYQNANQSIVSSIEALQELENFLIFNRPHIDYYRKSKLTFFDKTDTTNFLTLVLLRRLIALNLSKILGDKVHLLHDGNQIKFGLRSNLNCEFGFLSVWLDEEDANHLLGSNWKYEINTFLRGVFSNVPENFEIHFTMIGAPFDAFHVRISPK